MKKAIILGQNLEFLSQGWHRDAVAPAGTERLNYDGHLYATKVYNATYNDYAEYFPHGDDTIEAGDLIMLDTNSEEESYIKTTKMFDLAFGIVSSPETYAQCIGGNGDGDDEINFRPLALAGRVNVKVVGPAKKGDFLVASDIPGVAVAVDPTRTDIPRGAIVATVINGKETDEVELVWCFVAKM